MAYQNVGTPRFYIDLLSHNQSIGNIKRIRFLNTIDNDPAITFFDTDLGDNFLYDLIRLNPESSKSFTLLEGDGLDNSQVKIEFNNYLRPHVKGFFGILNHNFGSINSFFWMSNPVDGDESTWFGNYSESPFDDILNGDIGGGYGRAEAHNKFGYIKDGSSIMQGMFQHEDDSIKSTQCMFKLNDLSEGDKELSIGSIIWGTYYDMPVSPDLDLSMTVDFDGYDNTETLNGSTLTNTKYMGSPWWYDNNGNKREPWAIGDSTGLTKRNGRRVWNLKFSYMSDKDLFSSNYGSSNYTETTTDYSDDLTTDENNNDIFYYNIDTDDSFSSQVLNKISHGQKFIFQPDNTANNPSDFAICVLDADSFSMKRVAYNVYDISMKIKEVW